MELHRALDQISEIHEQLAKSEVYRGFRSVPVGLSGLLALGAAALQARLVDPAPTAFVHYWVSIAVVAITLSAAGIGYHYFFRNSDMERRRTRRVVLQGGPSLAAGAVVTWGVLQSAPAAIPLLPGLWSLLYALGIFAARPYLPRMVGWIGLFYLLGGVTLLALASSGASLVPWGMGLTFGLGQLAGAGVLYWNLERRRNGSLPI